MNKTAIWVLALPFFWLTSCHKPRSSKNINKSAADTTVASIPVAADTAVISISAGDVDSSSATTKTSTEAAAPLAVKELQFDYLVAKSKFSFKGRKQDFDNTNVNIRMKRDSVIWMSVTGIGFEVARGIITPDSIVFIDKIHKDYFVFTYEQLSKQYNFELNFPLLQAVIVGNMPFGQQPDARFVKENDFYILKQIVDRLEVDNYVAERTLKLSRLLATEVPTQNTFTLDYEDFRDVQGSLFPFVSQIMLNVRSGQEQAVNQTSMRLKHSKVELVSASPGFPFSIPSSYKRKR
ncbi:DUF4292 domain-containing protein [Dyadobacter sandarakinus]|uniref:DUF4292 domain-containing protein n=1 Tax=Dyadobacter sandarakinus TaxID=2747268 RepID=A0ABX7IDS2_9BACT|nr:DUF4292 domain-containing protein [Dyadobacter sandarakinus]